MTKYKHTHIRLSESDQENLKEIKETTELSTDAAAFRSSLSLYKSILEKIREGWDGPYLEREDKKLEITDPGIETVKYKSDKM